MSKTEELATILVEQIPLAKLESLLVSFDPKIASATGDLCGAGCGGSTGRACGLWCTGTNSLTPEVIDPDGDFKVTREELIGIRSDLKALKNGVRKAIDLKSKRFMTL